MSDTELNTFDAALNLVLINSIFSQDLFPLAFSFTETNNQLTVLSYPECKWLPKALKQGLPASSLKLLTFCNSPVRLSSELTLSNEY